jgi:predicted HAD superfamily Cof-like phosphohydrolase
MVIRSRPSSLVRRFVQVFGQKADKELRAKLLLEEVKEYQEANTPEEMLDALCDILYIAYGTAIVNGWDIDSAFEEVHRSNMSKLQDGKPIYREDGKVLKGSNYSPPDLTPFV